MFYTKKWFFVCLVVFAAGSEASSLQTIEASTANHPVWLQLLHAGQSKITHSENDFYLADGGFENPLAELKATLTAFQRRPRTQCRFPARRLFILRHLPDVRLPAVHCADYEAYLSAFLTDSVSLIYASGYLGNPASMFGHVFLKFNGSAAHNLLDNTFSYGAAVADSDNKLTYIAKGITGGYHGRFSNQKYHHHELTYNEAELRNLWEYQLNVERRDVAFLLAHLWELNNSAMTYYFFKQNCAYQLARLLELVLDRPLTAEGKYWVMPVDLVMQLANHTDHEPLYTDVRFHGSRQQALYTHWQQLSTEQQRVIHEILSAPANQAGDLVDTLTQDDAKAVIDTLYDYFSYIDRRQDGLNIRQKEIKRQVMLKRFALPPGQVDWQTSQPAAPHNAQLSTLIQGGISRSEHHTTRLLRFRANYYDLLTYNPGRIPFSELSTFDMTLQVDGNNKVQVQSFKLLNLINLNASQTGLPGDNALAWKLSLGYRQLANDCERCGSLYADGFVGKAWSANSNSVLYGALAVSITGSNRTGGNIAAGVEVGGVAHITPKLTMAFSTGQQWYLNELANIRQYAEIESRWLISQQWDIRATLRYQGQTESGLYLSYYY